MIALAIAAIIAAGVALACMYQARRYRNDASTLAKETERIHRQTALIADVIERLMAAVSAHSYDFPPLDDPVGTRR